MLKYSKILILGLILYLFFFCNKKTDANETILKGTVKILVDETLKPIIDDEVAVFESDYDAKVHLVPQSETEVLQSLFKDSLQIAILSRDLTKSEKEFFINKKIIPRTTPFATDAIAFIANKNTNDTLISLKEIVGFMNGERTSKIKGLVFDNPNSSTVRYLNELAGLKKIPETGVYSFKTNEEVVKYVSENKGMIGVVGVNWLSQPSPEIQKIEKKIAVLSVKSSNDDHFYYPSQENLASKKYPLARDLYLINCQGFSGLGMGFASFIAGERGQRIILKSGLLPFKMPSRKIVIRKEITNDKK